MSLMSVLAADRCQAGAARTIVSHVDGAVVGHDVRQLEGLAAHGQVLCDLVGAVGKGCELQHTARAQRLQLKQVMATS